MIALPLVSCLLIIGIALSVQMYNYSVEDKHDALEEAAERISFMTEDLYHNHSVMREQMFKKFVSSMTNNGKIHVIICDLNGQIFLTSDDYGNKYIGAHVTDDILKKTESVDTFSALGTLNGLYLGKNYTVGTTARNNIGKPVAYIYVTTSVNNIQQLMTYVRNLFSLLALLVFLIAALVSYFIVKRVTKPLKEISAASAKFARGDFSTRVSVQTNDEVGELTVAFNDMADSLEKSEELRRSFVANVSHELRSPMTSICGFIDGMLDGTIPEEKQTHYLTIVSDEVHRLSRLVSRMLDITTLQGTDITAQSKTFDFCELMRRCIISFEQRIFEHNLSLNIELPEHEVYINANEDAIYQVVYNLIDNAIKFSRDDSDLDIFVRNKGAKLLFSVKNYGTEIPEDEMKYIFDRFHKADKSRSKDKSGLGLGLYIAKNIINQHKGEIHAESRDNFTEFSFSLPVSQKS